MDPAVCAQKEDIGPAPETIRILYQRFNDKLLNACYFNLYGEVPDVKVLREWLGTSCDDRVLGYLNQK